MKSRIVRYERLYNLGDYSHEKIGIEIELDDGETATEGLRRAKDFCQLSCDRMKKAIEGNRQLIEELGKLDDEKLDYIDRKHLTAAREQVAEYERMEAELPL